MAILRVGKEEVGQASFVTGDQVHKVRRGRTCSSVRRAQDLSSKVLAAGIEGDRGRLNGASVERAEICDANGRGEAVVFSARLQRIRTRGAQDGQG